MAMMTKNRTRPFMGEAVNGGTVSHAKEGGRNVLTLSDDFKVPEAPAPHWQVVDSKGNAYLAIEGDRFNQSVAVPGYVNDIARVQIWCAFAEVLLGEATFEAPVS